MKIVSAGGLILGVALTFGLAACGSSGSSDVSDINTAAMTGGDIPSGFQLSKSGTADTWQAYLSTSLTNFGKIGGACGSASSPANDKNNFQHGLAQTALDANGYGIEDCALMLNSDDSAHTSFQDAAKKINTAPFKTVSKPTVGDESLAAQASASGITARIYGFRHGNTLVALGYIGTSGNVSLDELYTIAKNIDGRLK